MAGVIAVWSSVELGKGLYRYVCTVFVSVVVLGFR